MLRSNIGPLEHIKKAANIGLQRSINRHLKVVFLGAGSFFLSSLFSDILRIPGTEFGEMCLVDIDKDRLALAAKLCQKMINDADKKWIVTCETTHKQMLENANYIINCIEVSGTKCVEYDYHIPAKYGIKQCIGDTSGPGGLMKAMRTVPVFLDILRDIKNICPDAWVLNYTNPMSIMCLSAFRAGNNKVVGLCHSVQGTSKRLSEYLEIDYEKLDWKCAGINHLSWFTKLTFNSENLYPVLLDKIRDEKMLAKDPIRFDIMKHFGFFVTESSGHLSEYLPYYRKRPELINKYCGAEWLGESGFYAENWPTWRKSSDDRRGKQIAGLEKAFAERSTEYASYIIQAIETNQDYIIHGSVSNNSELISNLPKDGIVEVPCMVNGKGITPVEFGPLPPQCAALCDWNMRMYDLAASACIERSLELAKYALMLDPLTAAVCSPVEISNMADELFAAEKDYLKLYS